MSAENLFIAYWVVIENHSVGQQLKTDVDLRSEQEDLEWEVEQVDQEADLEDLKSRNRGVRQEIKEKNQNEDLEEDQEEDLEELLVEDLEEAIMVVDYFLEVTQEGIMVEELVLEGHLTNMTTDLIKVGSFHL